MFKRSFTPKTVILLSAFEGSIISFKGPLIEDLIKKNYKIYVLAPKFSTETWSLLVAMGAKPVEISLSRGGLNFFKDLFDFFRLVVVFKKIKPEIFIGYYIKPVIWGGLAAFISRVPKRIIMIEGLGHLFTKSSERVPLKILMLKFIVTYLYRISVSVSSTIFFLNNDDKLEFEKIRIIKKGKGNVLGGIGIRLHEWPRLKSITNPINFLFVGRMVKEKGLGEFIEAAKKIKIMYPDITFTALGAPEPREQFFTEDYLHLLNSDGIIRCPGHVNVLPWLKDCSVFVLPSYREGVPRSTQEAMACGKPVITSDAPGCKDTVISGKNGFLVEVSNVDSLVATMERFILEPIIITSMGHESRLIAEEKYDAHIVNQRFFDIADI